MLGERGLGLLLRLSGRWSGDRRRRVFLVEGAWKPCRRDAGATKGNCKFKVNGAQLKLAATNSTARSKAGVLKPAATTSTARLPWRQTCRTARSGCATGTIRVLRSSI